MLSVCEFHRTLYQYMVIICISLMWPILVTSTMLHIHTVLQQLIQFILSDDILGPNPEKTPSTIMYGLLLWISMSL